jgi:hypothetical protein
MPSIHVLTRGSVQCPAGHEAFIPNRPELDQVPKHTGRECDADERVNARIGGRKPKALTSLRDALCEDC